ncbi:hypothetical protein [Streptosporangium sp. NPDC087985]|uniref:hypothetical protein n=1 Tax=Streptosporangium sp. NPDC087985 TaxID=3366196 RepID=UPI00380381A3
MLAVVPTDSAPHHAEEAAGAGRDAGGAEALPGPPAASTKENPMVTPEPHLGQETPPPQQNDQLVALRQLFPDWYIEHDTVLRRWRAMRHQPLTLPEVKAGARYLILRASPERLGTALARQREITRTLRTARPAVP